MTFNSDQYCKKESVIYLLKIEPETAESVLISFTLYDKLDIRYLIYMIIFHIYDNI